MNPEIEFWIWLTRNFWLDEGYSNPLFSPHIDLFGNSANKDFNSCLVPSTSTEYWND